MENKLFGVTMDKHDTIRKIKELENFTTKLILDLIESEARKILNNDKDLYEFVMAMGSCFFVDMNKNTISNDYSNLDPENQKDLCDFFEMIYDFNERHNITGIPMRFTANGKKHTQW